MQICKVSVRLGGSLTQVVTDKEVTVPEIMILKTIHGADSVQDIRPVRWEAGANHAKIREDLAAVYEGNAHMRPEGAEGMVSRLFGAFGDLPKRLTDIGIDAKEEAKKLRDSAAEMLRRAENLEGDGRTLALEDELQQSEDGEDQVTDLIIGDAVFDPNINETPAENSFT